jgi:eukaryotic-like serine/threonine-protein kinase
MNDANRHVLTFFAELLEAGAPEAQAAYLDRVGGDDPDLRVRLEALLRAHQDAGEFLGGKTSTYQPQVIDDAPAPRDRPGTVIGPYKLLQQIGEGGMGAVFLAEQSQPVRRLVALKIIKPGMDSQQVIARFEAERQALALMDHPNIARVLDAGTTASGRPYFVMELVKGAPITKYCDERRLTPQQRLELFLPVCQAVQHAHQKGIIHRDLKPSNVLVAEYDDRPAAKVIDFGIAKAVGEKLTERTMFTGLGQVVGTLEYMSPEQAKFNALDVDTRSDVYSLGVLLYELLTGTTPFERKRLRQTAFDEILRVIREEEPPKPSTRLSATDELSSVAANRGLEPNKLRGLLRGELDWIVMKALEKDRGRRYDSANGLAHDLQRYLADEPVLAGPPSTTYRFRKFLRRNRGPVLAGLVLLMALVGGIVGTTVGLVRAEWALGEKEVAQQNEHTAFQEKIQEEQARNEEREQRIKVLERWRRVAYSLQITGAFSEYKANNVAWAEQMLDQCEPDLRAWEWRYLKRLCHGDEPTRFLPDYQSISRVGAFSPDAERFAFVELKGVHAYDVAARKELLSCPMQNSGHITQLAFSPDGKRLAIAAADKRVAPRPGYYATIHVWDIATATDLVTLEVKNAPAMNFFQSISFSPDSQWIAATYHAGKLCAWDANTGKERFNPFEAHVVPKGSNMLTRTYFSPDGKQLATINEYDRMIRFWEADTGKQAAVLGAGDGYARMAFSPNGRWVAAASPFRPGRLPDPSVTVWDRKKGTQAVFRGPTKLINSLTFSPDETRLVVGSDDGLLSIWDVETEKAVGHYRGPMGITSIFTPDGNRVLTLEGGPSIRGRDVTRAPEVLVLRGGASHAALSPNGKLAAASGKAIVLWDAETGKKLHTLENRKGSPESLAFSPDGAFLAAAIHRQSTGGVRVWDVKTGQLARALPDPDLTTAAPCTSAAFSPDGKLLAAGGVDRVVRVWDVATGEERYRLGGHTRSVTALAFSRDGKRLVSASGGLRYMVPRDPREPNPLDLKDDDPMAIPDLKVWDVATGKELRTLSLPERDNDGELALSPDGETVVVGFVGNFLRFYKLSTGELVGELKGRRGLALGVAFSPDGRRMVCVGEAEDRNIRLCDGKTGEEVLTLGCHPDMHINWAAFSGDGHKILSASNEDVRIWDATPLPK